MKKKLRKMNQDLPVRKDGLTKRLWKLVQPYRNNIIGSAAIVFVAGLALSGWYTYQEGIQSRAMVFFESAHDEKQFEILLQHYSGTRAAGLGLLKLGEIKWNQGEMGKAREYYEKYLTENPDNLFTPFVKNFIGECFLQEKKFTDAEKTFKNLMDDQKNLYIKSLAQMNMGRTQVAMGDIKNGLGMYNSLKKDNLKSPWKDNIEAFIRANSKKSVQ